jgi:hypothetical protein
MAMCEYGNGVNTAMNLPSFTYEPSYGNEPSCMDTEQSSSSAKSSCFYRNTRRHNPKTCKAVRNSKAELP